MKNEQNTQDLIVMKSITYDIEVQTENGNCTITFRHLNVLVLRHGERSCIKKTGAGSEDSV